MHVGVRHLSRYAPGVDRLPRIRFWIALKFCLPLEGARWKDEWCHAMLMLVVSCIHNENIGDMLKETRHYMTPIYGKYLRQLLKQMAHQDNSHVVLAKGARVFVFCSPLKTDSVISGVSP